MKGYQIGSLWNRTAKESGLEYMSGTINDLHGQIKIAVFPVGEKEGENQPDWKIVVSGTKEE